MGKRLTAILLAVIFAVVLTSCNQIEKIFRGKAPDLDRAFVSEVIISYENMEIKAVVTRYGMGLWNMAVSEPQTLAGLTVNYSNEGVLASFGELELSIPFEKIEPSAIFTVLFRTFDSAAAAVEMDLQKLEDGVRCTGVIDGLTYHLLFDAENNMLKSITLPDIGFEVRILSVS